MKIFFVHPKAEDLEMTNIRIHFMPPNTTSLIQPCDAGIINSFKCHFKNLLRQRISSFMDDNDENAEIFPKKITVLDAIHLVSNAWKLVSSEIIKNCFKSAFRGQKPSDLYKDLKLPTGFTIESYEAQLDLDCRNGYESDEDEDDLISNDDQEENDQDSSTVNDVTVVTPTDFLQCLDKVRSFAQSNGISEEIQKALSDLEALGVTKKLNSSSNQTQITKFFK